ncbi:MAG: DUF885 family protein [Sphingomonas sp.]
MIPRRLFGLLLAGLVAVAAPVAAATADDFRTLLDDHYQWLLRENPDTATALGVRDHDARIRDISPAARERRVREAQAFLARLDAIPADELSATDRVNRAILHRALSQTVDLNRFGQRDMIFNTLFGWHQGFAGLARSVPLRTAADFESYLSRIEQYRQLNESAIAVTEIALRGGYVLPCSVLGGYDRSISGLIVEDPTRSRYYEPFTRPRPQAIGEREWTAFQVRARRIVTDVITPQLRRHLAFFNDRYRPNCARSDSIADQPGGEDYYAHQVRAFTTSDLTPRQIHDVGQREIARIRGEMDVVAREAGFASRQAFIEDLRTNPRHYATTGEELMREVARVTTEINGHLPRLVGMLPRLTYTIREVPAEAAGTMATAYYGAGSPHSGIAAIFYVNTSQLNQRPLWEIPALSLHEAVPGHHLQIALQQEMEIAPFRRNFISFGAFTEGWGLYAESLGREMGLYNSPERRMGELSYQAWRAARLVVDTGIHAMRWDRARAIAFMRENTALTEANIEAEVNRYISWPGQALGYMIGRLKILELRERAERMLGEGFDLRRFHDAVLRNGSIPLDVLEQQINDWIAAERQR